MSVKFCVFSLALILGGTSCLRSYALDPKAFPPRSEVLADFEKSFKKGPVETFFDDRDKDPALEACRGWLKTATDKYEKAQAEGDLSTMDAVMAGSAPENSLHRQALSAAGDVSGEVFALFGKKKLEYPDGSVIAGDMSAPPKVTEKSGLVDLLQACGRCMAIVRVEKNTIYESEGWCKVPGTPKAAYDKAAALLGQWRNYPRHKEGDKITGFNSIAGFGLEDSPEPDVADIKEGDRAVIVVRTLGNSAFGYFGDIFFKTQEENQVKSYALQFNLPDEKKNSDLPGAYQFLKDPITGDEYDVEPLRTEVSGKWFVDAKGVLRYYTRADFGVKPYEFMKRIAFSVMMDAVFHMYQNVRDN